MAAELKSSILNQHILQHAKHTTIQPPAQKETCFGTVPFDQNAIAAQLELTDLTHLVVQPTTRSYQLVLDYVAQNLVGPGRSFEAVEGRPLRKASDEEKPSGVQLTAGFGLHRFFWKQQSLHCLRQTQGEPVGTNCCAEQKEFLVLFAEGEGSEETLTDFCSELIALSETTTKNTFTIFNWNVQNQFWQRSVVVAARPIKSVVLPRETKLALLTDLNDFLSDDSAQFYTEHGIPYKRSYLLYGLPGSGKTSLIQALAGHYGRNVCYIAPTHPLMTDDSLRTAVQDAPTESIIVFEDIDALFSRNRTAKVDQSPLTFSGLLNALDGIGNPQGQLFFLTTNHREQLDDALIRNGRVDLQVHFTHACREQIQDMYRAFRSDCQERADEFASALLVSLENRKISTAALQHYFVTHRRDNADDVIKNVGAVARQHDERESERAETARRESVNVDSKL